MTDLRIERDIEIEAPLHLVWRTIPKPDQAGLWFADRVESELKPGGEGYLAFGENKRRAAAQAFALAGTIGLGAAGWVFAVPRMSGMDMGTATTLGSFPFFLSVWVPMMAAMMLPGTAPSALRVAAGSHPFLDVPRYVASYLGVWSFTGILVFVLYRPHGKAVSLAIVLVAGVYELTPIKRRFRRMCRDRSMSGWELGLCCLGSSGGLMLAMVALGPMSLTWMAVLAGVLLVQKLVAPRAAVDLPIGLAIVALGLTQFTQFTQVI